MSAHPDQEKRSEGEGCAPAPPSGPMLTACSVRGDTIHARRFGERATLCSETNVNVTAFPFLPSSVWACKRCLSVLATEAPR